MTRKLFIFVFSLVWYRCLAAMLFEIFHHFGYLKSKYLESIANHHPLSSSPLFPLFTFQTGGASTWISMKIYFCTRYTHVFVHTWTPQLSCFVRSEIIFRHLKFAFDNNQRTVGTSIFFFEFKNSISCVTKNSKKKESSLILFNFHQDWQIKSLFNFRRSIQNENLSLIISVTKDRWQRFIPFTVAQQRLL